MLFGLALALAVCASAGDPAPALKESFERALGNLLVPLQSEVWEERDEADRALRRLVMANIEQPAARARLKAEIKKSKDAELSARLERIERDWSTMAHSRCPQELPDPAYKFSRQVQSWNVFRHDSQTHDCLCLNGDQLVCFSGTPVDEMMGVETVNGREYLLVGYRDFRVESAGEVAYIPVESLARAALQAAAKAKNRRSGEPALETEDVASVIGVTDLNLRKEGHFRLRVYLRGGGDEKKAADMVESAIRDFGAGSQMRSRLDSGGRERLRDYVAAQFKRFHPQTDRSLYHFVVQLDPPAVLGEHPGSEKAVELNQSLAPEAFLFWCNVGGGEPRLETEEEHRSMSAHPKRPG